MLSKGSPEGLLLGVSFYDKEEEGDKLALDDDNDVCIRYFLLY